MKLKINNLNTWSDAHIFYDFYANKKIGEDNNEYQWRHDVLKNSPHGKLLIKNSFFDNIKKSKKIYLAHVTPNFHNIQKDNILYPSSGCLVGSIYCTPVLKEGNRLRVHNLGQFILEKEMPLFSKFMKKSMLRPIETLLIEIGLPNKHKTNLIGIDYLRLGDIHYRAFKKLEHLLSIEEKKKLEEICINRIKIAFPYLYTCNQLYFSQNKLNQSDFLEMFLKNIEHLPILGYFYFEIISEYIMLYQDNKSSFFFNSLGEFYSPSYKELVFSLCPNLSNHFSLSQFKPTLKEIINYIKKNKIFYSLDTNHLFSYLTKRLIFLTNARFFNNNIKYLDWKKPKLSFSELSNYMNSLLGHLIHRELRSFGRYPHFYFYFDQQKALEIWNYWNYMNIIIPFNGIIPKGEIGINPAYPELKYKIYSTKTYIDSGKIFIEPKKKQNIEIVPKLVDPKFTIMGENKKEI